MAYPNVNRLWLMLPASRLRICSAPDRPMFSEPARSTKLSLPVWRFRQRPDKEQGGGAKTNLQLTVKKNIPILIRSSPAVVVSFIWIVIVKMQCERELALKEKNVHSESRQKKKKQTTRTGRRTIKKERSWAYWFKFVACTWRRSLLFAKTSLISSADVTSCSSRLDMRTPYDIIAVVWCNMQIQTENKNNEGSLLCCHRQITWVDARDHHWADQSTPRCRARDVTRAHSALK